RPDLVPHHVRHDRRAVIGNDDHFQAVGEDEMEALDSGRAARADTCDHRKQGSREGNQCFEHESTLVSWRLGEIGTLAHYPKGRKALRLPNDLEALPLEPDKHRKLARTSPSGLLCQLRPAADITPQMLTAAWCQGTKSLRDSGGVWLVRSVVPKV